MRLLKNAVKRTLRAAARWRVNHLPLSEAAATVWAERVKAWPALFDDRLFQQEIRLPREIRMQVSLVDHIERQLRLRGEWDLPVKQLLESLLLPGDTYIDLGANIGYFTLLASRLVGPSGTVVAVEPSIRALRKLCHHLWLNGCDNVVLLSCGVGDEWRRVRLGLATESNIGGSHVVVNGEARQRTEAVMLAPLDDLLQHAEVRPKLIKLDLEGFEFAALRGAARILEAYHPWIVCEVTDSFLSKYGASHEQLLAFLMALDYQPYRINSAGMPRWLPLELDQSSTAAGQHDLLFVPPGGAAMLPHIQ